VASVFTLQVAHIGANAFPKLKTLTRGQIAIIQEPEILEDLLLKVAIAQTQEEAQDYLLSWDPQDDELEKS
jgi:hypothetical protein